MATFKLHISRPSSTISAAAITGMVTTTLFEVLEQFYFGPRGISLRPTLVAGVTTLIPALAGYWIVEEVLPLKDKP